MKKIKFSLKEREGRPDLGNTIGFINGWSVYHVRDKARVHKILEPLLPLFQRQKSSCPSALFSIAIIVPTSSSSSSSYFSLSTTPSNLNPPTSLLLLTSHYTKKKKKIKKKMNKSSIFPPLPSCVVVVVG
ncbi:hypothetical protein GmHk_19G053736 [Glycine max]|nr:hypothetical protein GmHk_19G053736 [Glycine max]